MLEPWELFFHEIIQGKRKGVVSCLAKILFFLLSKPFQFIVFCRNWAYDHGWLSKYHPPVPLVISVGNVVVGGTGKTPVTLLLAKEFASEYTLAIISRGYRSSAENLVNPLILNFSQNLTSPPSYCGDEPYLLASKLPQSYVFVGKNRRKSSYMASKAGADIIILDDGMQSRRLARDLEVIVMDASDPFGRGYFLPRGYLRESLNGLSRAHLIILNHIESEDHFSKVKNSVHKYTSAPIVGTRYQVSDIFTINGKSIQTLENKKVGMFCGIAHPEKFRSLLQEQHTEIVAELLCADHIAPSDESLQAFAKECKKKHADMLICTEKDRVKLQHLPPMPLPVSWIEVSLHIAYGKENWECFVRRAKMKLKPNPLPKF